MKFLVIIFSLFFAAIHCHLSVTTEITASTDLNTVIGVAIEASKTHSPNLANAYVRQRHDFAIKLWLYVVENFTKKSQSICTAIETDAQQVLSFYASNRVLHDAAQGLVSRLTNTITTITASFVTLMREKEKIAIPAADFIMHDVETSKQKLRSLVQLTSKVCVADFKKTFRTMASGSNTCAKTVVIDAEMLYFDYGFKLADVHQGFLDTIKVENIRSLSNADVLARFRKFEADIIADLNTFSSSSLVYIQNFYDKYMSCIAQVLVSSRTSEGVVRSKAECLALPFVPLSIL